MSLHEISENVKLAREYALLGNYSYAIVCYQGVLEQIKKHLFTLRDSSFQQRWQKVWQEINEENKQVEEIMTTLENFKLETTPTKPPSNKDGIRDKWPVQVEGRSSPLPVRGPPVPYKESKHHNNRLYVAGVRAPHRQSPRGPNVDRAKPLKSKEKNEKKTSATRLH
uniref:Katanin catalytic subunit A1 n=1 Tax=Oncorhynchus mykiss TaxID=8022 RepID=A0A8K9XMJ1_ONCMY